MFTLAGFMFDAVILWSLAFELVGCGIGCAILRSSGRHDDTSDGCGIGTGIVFTIFSVIAIGILGYWGYLPTGSSLWQERYAILAGGGIYLVLGFIASGIWLGGWMRGRTDRFKCYRRDWLKGNNVRNADDSTAVPAELKAAWQDYLRHARSVAELGALPPFSTYRAYLGRRIAWWPLYAVNFVVCDIIPDIFGKAARLMARFAGLFKKVYEDLARSYLSEIAADATVPAVASES